MLESILKRRAMPNHAGACNNLGALYFEGKGIKQNKSMAKNTLARLCDLGEQVSCDNYRVLNERGVK